MFLIGLNITTITISNSRAFKEFLRPLTLTPNSTASWLMSAISTSKGAMKMLGCALYIMCTLSIEKYGN
jgi:hypothetical protein